jgi:hypothetical protein
LCVILIAMDLRSTPSMMVSPGSIPTSTFSCLCSNLGQATTVRGGRYRGRVAQVEDIGSSWDIKCSSPACSNAVPLLNLYIHHKQPKCRHHPNESPFQFFICSLRKSYSRSSSVPAPSSLSPSAPSAPSATSSVFVTARGKRKLAGSPASKAVVSDYP